MGGVVGDTPLFPHVDSKMAADVLQKKAQKGTGIHQYYVTKIEEVQVSRLYNKVIPSPLFRLFQLAVSEKSQNLRRLEAQRNELNAKGWSEVLMLTACDCVWFSSLVTRGTTAASRAGLSCWRGGETDGQEEGAREGI